MRFLPLVLLLVAGCAKLENLKGLNAEGCILTCSWCVDLRQVCAEKVELSEREQTIEIEGPPIELMK